MERQGNVEDSVALLCNRIIESQFPVIFLGKTKDKFALSHPAGCVLYSGEEEEDKDWREALENCGERRNGLVVILNEETTLLPKLQESITLSFPKICDRLMVYDSWTCAAGRYGWLNCTGEENGFLSETFPSIVTIDWPLPPTKRGEIFLCGKAIANNPTVLKKIGCHNIVNCCANEFLKTEKYLQLALEDEVSQPLEKAIAFSVPWIHEKIIKGENVLIHCERGVSRSVSICCSYLILKCDYPPKKAIEWVKMCRSAAEPNPGFVAQLLNLDRKLFEGF